MLHIGVQKAGVEAVHKLIMDILKAPCGDSVKSEAFQTVRHTLQISNVSLQNCIFKVK
jgi:hypothetical protein